MQWPPPEGTGTAGPSQKKGWLYSRSVSLTHNGEWSALPHDAVPANATENALVQYVAGEPSATVMWAEFKRKIDALVDVFRPNEWASSQEICLQTWSPRSGLRVHFHADKDASMHTQQGEMLRWRGALPYKVDHAFSWVTRTQSGFRVRYYLVAPKIGSVRKARTASSKQRRQVFSGQPVWEQNLVSIEKMTRATAREVLTRGGSG